MLSLTIVYSDSPPPDAPSPWQSVSTQRLWSPAEHGAHVPQVHNGCTVTRSPVPTGLTPLPTATTSPENSCPMTNGSGAGLIGPT